jgi:hypothetical protein
MDYAPLDLVRPFQAAAEAMSRNREAFNRADEYNGNHGDHMVRIFEAAARAMQSAPANDLAGAMETASQLLSQQERNGSAQVYALGLGQFARAFGSRQITYGELLTYIQGVLSDKKEESSGQQSRSGDVLKALLSGLYGWQKPESEQPQAPGSPDVGYLFDLGIIYLQAKQRGGSRAETLADAAISASPLSQVPHRFLSGKTAFQALLEAIGG